MLALLPVFFNLCLNFVGTKVDAIEPKLNSANSSVKHNDKGDFPSAGLIMGQGAPLVDPAINAILYSEVHGGTNSTRGTFSSTFGSRIQPVMLAIGYSPMKTP